MPSLVYTSHADPTSSRMAPTPAQPVDESHDRDVDLSAHEDCVDPQTFEQILEMDDDEVERDFSKSIVYGFFEQAESTFDEMDNALARSDLDQLSQLGHFLKGSSATLGLTKVKDACEKIQHYGAKKDESGTVDEPDDAKSLGNIKKTMTEMREAYKEVTTLLRRFYRERAA